MAIPVYHPIHAIVCDVIVYVTRREALSLIFTHAAGVPSRHQQEVNAQAVSLTGST
jgi:hypothetical protein